MRKPHIEVILTGKNIQTSEDLTDACLQGRPLKDISKQCRPRTQRHIIWAASSEFGTYRLCEQRRFRRACASAQKKVSPEPPLLAHTSSESRGTFRQKARSQAPLNGWACAVKIYHDGMLEDTNSLNAAQLSRLFAMITVFLINEPHHAKMCLQRFSSRSDSNQPAQLQKLARILKLWI